MYHILIINNASLNQDNYFMIEYPGVYVYIYTLTTFLLIFNIQYLLGASFVIFMFVIILPVLFYYLTLFLTLILM
jgi:hypothetical protein